MNDVLAITFFFFFLFFSIHTTCMYFFLFIVSLRAISFACSSCLTSLFVVHSHMRLERERGSASAGGKRNSCSRISPSPSESLSSPLSLSFFSSNRRPSPVAHGRNDFTFFSSSQLTNPLHVEASSKTVSQLCYS